MSYHEALFSSIKQKSYLKSAMNLSDSDAQLLEVNVIRRSLDIARNHDMPQASLKSAICLSKLAESCSSKGISIEGAAKFDLANVLWDQGEMTTSIRMLQQLSSQNNLHKQAVPISRAELLVTLVSYLFAPMLLFRQRLTYLEGPPYCRGSLGEARSYYTSVPGSCGQGAKRPF